MTGQEKFDQKSKEISDARDIKTPDTANISAEIWEKSRGGAWAARGFDYQYMVSTLILVRQWAGLAPSGYLVINKTGLQNKQNEEILCRLKSRSISQYNSR